MTKIAVAGFGGRLGSTLVVNYGYDRLLCDITKIAEVNRAIEEQKPDVIINCAALTGVDAAEDNYEDYLVTNGSSVNMFTSFVGDGGKLIHISTDYVFDGKHGPYKETDEPIHQNFFGRVSQPVNRYGWSKFAGELAIKYLVGDTCIVRTTGLFGSRNDYASYFLDKLQSHQRVDVMSALVGNHTYIPYLAMAIDELIHLKKLPEIVHIASEDVTSRYDFCVSLAEEFGLDTHLIHSVKSIPGWKAQRPTKGGLKVGLAKKLGLTITSSLEGIRAYKNSVGG